MNRLYNREEFENAAFLNPINNADSDINDH